MGTSEYVAPERMKKQKYNERELDRIHAGKGYKKGRKAEAERQLKEHRRTILALVVVFVVGAVVGALATRNRD